MEARVSQAPIGYTGEVTLEIVDKEGRVREKQTIYNNGVNKLFELLLEFLCGRLTTGTGYESLIKDIQIRLPKYLAVGTKGNPAETDVKSTMLQEELNLGSRFPLMTNKSIGTTTKGLKYCQWTCNVPQTSIGNEAITELGLFAGGVVGRGDMLARVKLPEAKTLEYGQSLLVNWRIFFTNKIEQGE